MMAAMSLAPIGVSITLSYIPVYFLFGYFFAPTVPPLSRRSLYSLLGAAALFALAAVAVYLVPNVWWGNRVQHAFGGGFVILFICYRAAVDAQLDIARLKFVIFSAFIVTALGVCNELIELTLQTYTHYVFSSTVTDTWFDLASNTVGLALGSVVFAPLIGARSMMRSLPGTIRVREKDS